MTRPLPTSQRASIRPISRPAIHMLIRMPTPRTASTQPVSITGQSNRRWSIGGSSAIDENMTMPITIMNPSAVSRLRSASIRRSNKVSRAVSRWIRNIHRQARATPVSIHISRLSNQSFCAPRSSMSWSDASPSASIEKPNRSNLRSLRPVAGSSAQSSASVASPTGRLT